MYGIYIHFPYCIHKCSYCDFYSIENLNTRNKFVDMLCKEIEIRAYNFGKKIPANSLFFGGGTPSLMKIQHITKIFSVLQQYVDFDKNSEMTIECNPGAIDIKNLDYYLSLGINRISFGVQSFLEKDLKFLERIHSTEDIYKSIEKSKSLGFKNISIDLMFALPNQSIEDWKYNLEKSVELDIQHISAYSLIYEPSTPLYDEYISGKISPQDEDKDAELYYLTNDILSENGFKQYEISNYAKDNFQCKHNLNYWNSGEYFGFGPSAHSYVNGIRFWNYRSNDKYFQLLKNNQLAIEASENLTTKQKIFESIYLGLRSLGIDLIEIQKKYSIDLYKENQKNIKLMIDNNLLYIKNNVLRLSNKGYFISDNITIELSKCLDNLI